MEEKKEEIKINEADLVDLKEASTIKGVSLSALKAMLSENNTLVVKKGKSILIEKSILEGLSSPLKRVPYNELSKPRGKRGNKPGPKPKE